MIRYDITSDELLRRIEALVPGWLKRAARRTTRFRNLGRYEEKSGIWSEIKDVYRKLQGNKCAFCERQLAGEPYGNIEHDVEHYRPKSSVRLWPADPATYAFPTGDAFDEGYYLLAYHHLNYAAACKPCNSSLKSNYFPIAGPRGPQTDDPLTLHTEQPFLPYPIGTSDEDPEDLIRFEGTLALPRDPDTTSHRWRRARVTIDFFALNIREELQRERSRLLIATYLALDLRDSADALKREVARRWLAAAENATQPHRNCVRSFRLLYEADPVRAGELAQAASDYLDSPS